MPTLSIPGGQVFYEVKGQGQPIVILRGMSFSSRHWLGFDDVLAKDFQVISIDNRGIGRSKCKVGPGLSMNQLAKDVVQVLDEEGIEKAHMMGFSLGGMIALAIAMKHPSRCLSAIVINSSIAGFPFLRLSLPAIYHLLRYGYRKDRLLKALSELLFHQGTPHLDRKSIYQHWVGIAKEEGFPLRATLFQMLAAGRFFAKRDLSNLAVPTLVVYGAKDRFVPVINSMMLHQTIPHAKLVKIEDAGHELMLDKPLELKAAIEEFTTTLR